jgi:hypothetical protein
MIQRDEDEHGDCWVFSIFPFFFLSVSYNQPTSCISKQVINCSQATTFSSLRGVNY